MAAFPSLTLKRKPYGSLSQDLPASHYFITLAHSTTLLFMWVQRAMSVFRISCIFSLLLSGRMDAARNRVFGLSMYWRGLLNSRLQACTAFPMSVVSLYLADKSVCFE